MSKELDVKEQEKIYGGLQADTSHIKEGHVGAHVAAIDARNYINRMFYVISDDNPDAYCYGVLIRSSEHSKGCNDVIIHDFKVHHVNPGVGINNGGGHAVHDGDCTYFYGENVTLYLKEVH